MYITLDNRLLLWCQISYNKTN